MKRIRKIFCAAAAALTACAEQDGRFSTELAEDGRSLTLTAENADKGTSAGRTIEVLEGERVIVSGNITSGAVQFRMLRDGSEKPSVDLTFMGMNEKIEYSMAPGSYMVSFIAGENKTSGIVSAEKKVISPLKDGENPIKHFIGVYAKEGCLIEVSAADSKDRAQFFVRWGSIAAELSEWHMSGTFDTETQTVHYENCEKKNVVLKEDRTAASETVVYENGKGSFQFSGSDSSLIWNDEEEHQADGMTFGWAIID